MGANSEIPSVRRLLRAAALACLLVTVPVPHAGAAGCTASVDLNLDGHVIRGEAPRKGSGPECGCRESMTGTANDDASDVTHISRCRKTEVHKDGEEFRSRTTTINSDGSANPQGEDTKLLLKEGEMRLDKKDGEYGQFGGEWPDDEYTRRIPRPTMPLVFATFNPRNNTFRAMFKEGASRESDFAKMKAYVEKLKERGFTVDAKESDKMNTETPYYAYRAKNKEGYRVRVTCCGVSGVDLRKPK